jgi:LmbE family N-acetylglucosaminyl deacetylase
MKKNVGMLWQPTSAAASVRRSILVLFLWIAVSCGAAASPKPPQKTATTGAPPRVLIVVAHPDDETCFAATVYEITHNLGGTVDELVITNGEGGYRYSLLAETYYDVAFTNEATGRAALPEIRKRELKEAAHILGIAHLDFLDQPDVRYTQDIDEVLDRHWNAAAVREEVARRIASGHYDFIFTLFPSPETHGAHKAATLTALDAVAQMPDVAQRPVVLACQDGLNKGPAPSWKGFQSKRHPFTVQSAHVYITDRDVSFGFRSALDYQIIVNWVIAAHKSQGKLQMGMNRADWEEFVVLESGLPGAALRTRELFHALALAAPHPRGVSPVPPSGGRR